MFRRILILVMVIGFFATSAGAGGIEKAEEKAEEIKASVIIPMKIEGLKWKLKYHQEKITTAQLLAMIRVWSQVEFQDLQKIIRQTDQEIKRLLALE